MKRLVIVGAGAAGMAAAGFALQRGCAVTLLDPFGTALKKLRITGKGRCNLTNDCDMDALMENIPKNARFLRSALTRFGPADAMALFEDLGVPLKVERGNRVFPVSDKAGDVADALRRFAAGAEVHSEKAKNLLMEDGRAAGVRTTSGRAYLGDAVLLATGGLSYPATGSDGSGFALARAAGHRVTELVPSLVPLVSPDPVCGEMQGLSLKNVALLVFSDGKKCFEEQGELLFTHFGLSGPLVLSASCHLRDFSKPCRAVIDLKPALDRETLDKRILRDFSENQNRNFANSLGALLPAKMIGPVVCRSGIPPEQKVHSVTKEQRRALVDTLKGFAVPITGFRPVEEAIVTSGGILVKEVDPKTMESKLVKGLYFAGEVLDVDGYTGGFNLQIAWSTAYAAAMAAGGE